MATQVSHPATRKRLAAEESRARALEAARQLLIDQGPQAVTLQAVAHRISKGHANLLHHFGSAANLQRELAHHMADKATEGISAAIDRAQHGEADLGEVVDLTFDAYGKEGGGALAAWMILTGNWDALDPVLKATQQLVDRLPHCPNKQPLHEMTLWLVLAALGDSLLGGALARALNLPAGSAREIARKHLGIALASDELFIAGED